MAGAAAIGEPAPVPGTNNMASGFAKMCRTCAACTDCLMPIFSGEGLLNNLADKIHRHLPIRVSERDRLPQQLCRQCASTLLAWHELVKCCTQADAALRVRLQRLQERAHQENEVNVKHETALEAVQTAPIGEQGPSSEQEHKTSAPKHENESESEPSGDTETEVPRSVSEDGAVECGRCGKRMRANAWRRHARTHEARSRSCHECGRTFVDAGNLVRHARAVHAFIKPFACDCGATFTRKSHLEDHARTHSIERAFVCEVCGVASKSAAGLRVHRLMHTSEPTHVCKYCDKTFKRAGELRAHITVHTGERPHACECGRAFRLRAQLAAHARTHRLDIVCCPLCGDPFRQRRYLAKHLLRVHKHSAGELSELMKN